MAPRNKRLKLRRNQTVFLTTPTTPMKQILHAASTLLILAGCAPAPPQAIVPKSNSPEIQTPTEQTITHKNAGVEPTLSTINAITLLDETLETATMENKRVLVHLGATW